MVEGDWVRGEKGRDHDGEGEEEDEDSHSSLGRGLAVVGMADPVAAVETVDLVEAEMVGPVVADYTQEVGGCPCYMEVR